MSYFFWKLFVGFIIFLLALLGGSIPLIVKTTKSKYWLNCGNAFSNGIFLGMGLIHLLPEAQFSFCATSNSRYPLVFVVCTFSILFLCIIEESIKNLLIRTEHGNKVWIPCLLMILLSIHSVLEGTALGIQSIFEHFMLIFIAISMHKSIAAFALGINMRKNMLSRSMMFSMIGLFSVMTPIGIFFGSSLSGFLTMGPKSLLEAIFDAIVAGTFIYIAVFQTVLNGNNKSVSSRMYLTNFSFGLILMAVMGIWI